MLFCLLLPTIILTKKEMNKRENIITLAVLIGLVALVFFIYNWFDANKLDYRALVAIIISLSITGYYLTRGKFRV